MNEWDEEISVNPFQFNAILLPAKVKVHVAGRASGKSFQNGYELYDNIKIMPRGITTITQRTYGQALTKTLPSTFKLLEKFGLKRYNPKIERGIIYTDPQIFEFDFKTLNDVFQRGTT